MESKGWTRGDGAFFYPADTMADAAAQVETNEGRAEYITHMLGELNALDDRELTAWETDFLASVGDQFDRRGSLTDKQMATLERIYAEKAE